MLAWMEEIVGALASALIAVLPHSPVAAYLDTWQAPQGLKWLAWFFPVGQCLAILSAWLVAVAAFYLISILLRWVKVIGD